MTYLVKKSDNSDLSAVRGKKYSYYVICTKILESQPLFFLRLEILKVKTTLQIFTYPLQLYYDSRDVVYIWITSENLSRLVVVHITTEKFAVYSEQTVLDHS